MNPSTTTHTPLTNGASLPTASDAERQSANTAGTQETPLPTPAPAQEPADVDPFVALNELFADGIARATPSLAFLLARKFARKPPPPPRAPLLSRALLGVSDVLFRSGCALRSFVVAYRDHDLFAPPRPYTIGFTDGLGAGFRMGSEGATPRGYAAVDPSRPLGDV